MALIAHRAGVSATTVARATDPFGPFPRPSRQLGRVVVDEAGVTARTRRWVRMRLDGVAVMSIAAAEEVAHQVVSRATAPFGPYPRPHRVDDATLEQWILDRRDGVPVAAIAAVAKVGQAQIHRATHPHGPFPPAGNRIPKGVVGASGLADTLGVPHPTITRWRTTGFLPTPDVVTHTGRALWLDTTIATWRQNTHLDACPTCGGLFKRLRAHTSLSQCGRPAAHTEHPAPQAHPTPDS